MDHEPIEEIVVTGTRIKRTDTVTASPLTQISADEILYHGVTRIEDILNDLPQVFPDQHSNISNLAVGTATIDLRGLGSARTLTLLNGRRLPPGSPWLESTDVNQIPVMLIDRVELLTGGASATYGSDAVGGVVNFIVRDDIEGLQFDYQFSQYQHRNSHAQARSALSNGLFEAPASTTNDGTGHNVSVVYGSAIGSSGNITAYASYRNIDAVSMADRDYSACFLRIQPGEAWRCGGSPTIADGRFTDFGALARPPATWDPNANGPWPGSFDLLVDPGTNQFVARAGHPGEWYNFAPLNYFQRPDERITAGAFGHFDISDRIEAYFETNYMDYRSLAQVAESGSFYATSSLNCDNPLLSQQQFDLLCGRYNLTRSDRQTVFIGRRNVEGGPRIDDLKYESIRGVLGIRGSFNEQWSYDAFANIGRVDLSNLYINDMSISRITRALDVVPDPATGQPVCASVLDGTDPNCVPWNVFESGAVTQAMVDYLAISTSSPGETRRLQVSGYLSGNLSDYGWVVPGTVDGVRVVLGAEYREDELHLYQDENAQSGDVSGWGGAEEAPVHGTYDLKEVFAEASVPLLQWARIAELVSVDLGYRHSDYSTGVDVDTYKVAGEWVVNPVIHFRASAQHAARAGTIHELFRPRSIYWDDARPDTCVGAEPISSFEQCRNTGVTAAQYGTIADLYGDGYGLTNAIVGGNPNLEPEESDTVSFGVILTPEFIPSLSVTVDYFEIDVDKAIRTASSAYTFNQCLQTGLAEFCDKVQRDPATGSLRVGDAAIVTLDTNIAFMKTSGFDARVDYTLDVGRMGDVQLSLAYTYIDELLSQENPDAETIECAGLYNFPCEKPGHDRGGNLRTVWNTPWDASVSLNWRHIGSIDNFAGDGNDIDAVDYFDLAATWDVGDSTTLRLGVNNVFDEDPPVVDGTFYGDAANKGGNTMPGTYDALGRYLFAGASVRY